MAKGYLYDNGDELITREDVNEVPDSSTAHAGDVLELDSNKKPKWSTPSGGLPDTTSASEGDVLSLDEDKEPVWSAPSGGGGGISAFIDYEGTPVEDQGVNYYPVKMENGDQVTPSVISSNISKPIIVRSFWSEEQTEGGETAMVTTNHIAYITQFQEIDVSGTMYYTVYSTNILFLVNDGKLYASDSEK